ncbi:GTPase Obg [Diplonema papillatum]|nr:GTPase Obg [Diplonema papillatum]
MLYRAFLSPTRALFCRSSSEMKNASVDGHSTKTFPKHFITAEAKPVFRKRHYSFIDKITFLAKGGDGGTGGIHWYRYFNNPMGGPAGGDGGNGGDVKGQCTPVYQGLQHLVKMGFITYDPANPMEPVGVCTAGIGINGDRAGMGGNYGHTIVLPLPPGCVVIDADTNRELVEFTRVGEMFTFATGGKGGRGNYNLKSSVATAPDYAEMGHKGLAKMYTVELRQIADVCLIGPANSGKSTLLGAMSRGAPEAAPWAYTTWRPFVGQVHPDEGSTFSVVDLPPLYPGAHTGKARVDNDFLKHAVRTSLMVYVVDICANDFKQRDNTKAEGYSEVPVPLPEVISRLQEELEFFEEGLSHKAVAVAVTKMDLLVDPITGENTWDKVEALQKAINLPVFPLSAHNKRGVLDLSLFLAKMNRKFEDDKQRAEIERTESLRRDHTALDDLRVAEAKQVILQNMQDFHLSRAVETLLEDRIRTRQPMNETQRQNEAYAKERAFTTEDPAAYTHQGDTLLLSDIPEDDAEPYVKFSDALDAEEPASPHSSETHPEDWDVGGMEELLEDRRTEIRTQRALWGDQALGFDQIMDDKVKDDRSLAIAAELQTAADEELKRPEYAQELIGVSGNAPPDVSVHDLAARREERLRLQKEAIQEGKPFVPPPKQRLPTHSLDGANPRYREPPVMSEAQRRLKEIIHNTDSETEITKLAGFGHHAILDKDSVTISQVTDESLIAMRSRVLDLLNHPLPEPTSKRAKDTQAILEGKADEESMPDWRNPERR